MPSILLSDNGVSSGSAGLKSTAASDGALALQTTTAGGVATTAISIDTSQNVTFANNPTYTSGTANGVLYLNGSKAVTSGSALVFDGSNLGLGVTPSAYWSGQNAIQVGQFGAISQGNGTGVAYNAAMTSVGFGAKKLTSGYATLYQSYNGQHAWYYSASAGAAGDVITWTQAMTLDASGNLGVGVSPTEKLTVAGNIKLGTSGTATIYGPSTTGRSVFSNSDGTAYLITYGSSYGSGVNSTINFVTGTSNVTTLDASGRLGVGTTSPTYPLTVQSNSSTQGIRLIGRASDNIANVSFVANDGSTEYAFFNTGATYFAIGTNGSERARIDSSGNLLVGKTAVNNTSTGFSVENNFGAGGSGVKVVNSASTNASDGFQMYSTGAGAYRFYVSFNGTISATTTTISAISDIRFKENVRDLDAGLAEVMALKPRLYDWKKGKGADIKNARGFIAQEFEEVFPDLIDEWRDPAPEGEEPYKSVRQDLIPVLVKAIQEQQAIIEQLKADVAALKGA